MKVAQIEAYSRRYIAAHWELLNSRARQGRIHEGHGDLRADAVYLTAHGIRIVDCLEFDERLRYRSGKNGRCEATLYRMPAAEDVIMERLRQREQDARRISDANAEIYLSQIRDFEALNEIPSASHRVVDTNQPHAAALLEIERIMFTD